MQLSQAPGIPKGPSKIHREISLLRAKHWQLWAVVNTNMHNSGQQPAIKVETKLEVAHLIPQLVSGQAALLLQADFDHLKGRHHYERLCDTRREARRHSSGVCQLAVLPAQHRQCLFQPPTVSAQLTRQQAHFAALVLNSRQAGWQLW